MSLDVNGLALVNIRETDLEKDFNISIRFHRETIMKAIHNLVDKNKERVNIEFEYGNTHNLLDMPLPPTQSSSGSKIHHEWKVYVKIKDNSLNSGDYIESVHFKLHPTFKNRFIECDGPPFEYRTTGWGTFMISILIFWKPELKKTPARVYHNLSFHREGKKSYFIKKF